MCYIVESGKSFDQATEALQQRRCAMLHVADLGATLRRKIGLIKPTAQMLASLSQDRGLAGVARNVEEATICMVDEAR